MSTASTSKEIFLRLPGSHDRIINHLRLYESFSTCPRSNSKAPRSRRLGYYRQFPGENMRFYLVVGSTHMGSAGPGYDQPAITTVDLCNHSRREQASEKGFIHRCGDTQSSRSRYLGCQDIFFVYINMRLSWLSIDAQASQSCGDIYSSRPSSQSR